MRLLLLLLLCCVVRSPPPANKPGGGGGGGGPSGGSRPAVEYQRQATNILVLVLDDVGTNGIRAYDESELAPRTPVIDGLARDGVLFRNGYSYPTCSSARAALLTGRYARRTGMGDALGLMDPERLDHAEILLPEMLKRAPTPFASMAVGKWHLAGKGAPGWERDALDQGFGSFRGAPANLVTPMAGLPNASYTHFEKITDGVVGVRDVYATTDTVDDAVSALRTLPEPWLGWVAFNAAHDPWHVPPAKLQKDPIDASASMPEKFRASIVAMDTEIGRLLDSLGPEVRARTLVFVIGDNGTPGQVVPPPLSGREAKHTLYEGGTNVPFIVSGAGVAARGTESKALVHVVDVFPTIAEVAHVTSHPRKLDGMSLRPLLSDPAAPWPREVLFTESFYPVGAPPWDKEYVAVRDRRFKWMELREDGETNTYLFDLKGRVDDGPNLLDGPLDAEAREARERLKTALRGYERLPYEGPARPPSREARTGTPDVGKDRR